MNFSLAILFIFFFFFRNAGDIVLYKGTGPVLSATFNSDGTFATTCEIKVEKFPFNTAECYWDIGLARDNNMFLSFGGGILMADDPRANIGFPSSKFIPPTSIWQLEQTPYPFNLSSVPDLNAINKVRIVFNFSRVVQYYLLSIFLPILILVAIIFAAFILPPDSGDRVSFAVTVMLAFSVLQPVVTVDIPKTAEPVYLFYYIQTHLVLVAAATVYIILVHTFSLQEDKHAKIHRMARTADVIVAVILLIFIVVANIIFFRQYFLA